MLNNPQADYDIALRAVIDAVDRGMPVLQAIRSFGACIPELVELLPEAGTPKAVK